jgi:hypothetical protein
MEMTEAQEAIDQAKQYPEKIGKHAFPLRGHKIKVPLPFRSEILDFDINTSGMMPMIEFTLMEDTTSDTIEKEFNLVLVGDHITDDRKQKLVGKIHKGALHAFLFQVLEY